MKMKAITAILPAILLIGCTALTGLATDAVLGSASKGGIEATAQVGKENNKGLVNTKVDTSKKVKIEEVAGDANIGSGNTITNDARTMIGLVLAGMFFPCLLLFYLLPTPRWIARRFNEDTNSNTSLQGK